MRTWGAGLYLRLRGGIVRLGLGCGVPVLYPRLVTNTRREAVNTQIQGVEATARGRGLGMFFGVSDGLG